MAVRLSGWRKISAATWRAPSDPQMYGDVELDARPLLAYVEAARADGHPVTVTHLVGKAVAHALARNPDLNGRIRLGRFVRRPTVDIFFIASTADGDELSGVKVARTDEKAVTAIADEVAGRAARLRSGEEDDLGQAKGLLDRLPTRVLRWLMGLLAVLSIDLDLDLPAVGVRRQTFGSALVSSVGMFGIGHAYAPLSPFYRVPFLVLVGEVADRAVVEDGVVVARPMLTVSATMDHRYLDGFHAARLARDLRAYCADPAAFEPPLAAQR
ncbi:2-oxo acid dehydrogenase subunit E2 [Euzebya sp.]|uniref:2-oxo acid dehydrogenase subunit E2 n=1 Tax=Euzebya sp. TaxID=1971409 RepID=UPI003517ECD7